MNSQTWKHVSSEPSKKRSRRGRMGQVGPNLQSTTFHKIHLQWKKVCVPLLDELWGSLAILHIFWKTKSGHLLKILSPTYDAIIILLLLVKGLKIDHCFLTYWWGLPNSPLPAPSRNELGDTQHVHPSPNVKLNVHISPPPLCIPVKFYHIQEKVRFFFLSSPPKSKLIH